MTQEYWHETSERRQAPQTKPRHTPMPAVADDLYPDMARYLWSRELLETVAEDNGWYPSRSAGDAHPRIVIPATNTLKYNYWQARQFGDPPRLPRGRHAWRYLRYQSPMGVPRLDSLIVCRPRGITPAHNHLVIVEGPFCALAAACAGFVGIATMGNMPTTETVQHLFRYAKRFYTTTIIPDGDDVPAGFRLAAQFARRGLWTKTTPPAIYKDLCQVPRCDRVEAVLGR